MSLCALSGAVHALAMAPGLLLLLRLSGGGGAEETAAARCGSA